MINAVRHFEAYLLGHQFDIVTDYSTLKYLTTIKHGGARLARWALASTTALQLHHIPPKPINGSLLILQINKVFDMSLLHIIALLI